MIDWSVVGVAAIAAVPPTLLAIATLIQSKRNAAVAAKTAEAVESNDTKTDTLTRKVEEVHVLTNSNLTKVTADLALSIARVEELQALVGRLVAARDGVPTTGPSTPQSEREIAP